MTLHLTNALNACQRGDKPHALHSLRAALKLANAAKDAKARGLIMRAMNFARVMPSRVLVVM